MWVFLLGGVTFLVAERVARPLLVGVVKATVAARQSVTDAVRGVHEEIAREKAGPAESQPS